MDKAYGLLVGVAAFILVMLLPLNSVMPHGAQMTAAVTVLIVIFWIMQPIPIEATALIPLVVFPLLGVLSVTEAAVPYADNVIFLFMGGFMIAMAMQRWNLHRRIALSIVPKTGASPTKLILGFMISTAFLSMWISNSATAMMMIPIAVAIILTVFPHKSPKEMDKQEKAFAGCLVLSIAYSAGVGGIATLIGTPANAIFASMLSKFYPDAPPVDFFTWMLFGVPFAALMILIVWLWLTKIAYRKMPKNLNNTKEILQKQVEELGPMGQGEKNTLFVFLFAALAWIFKDQKQIGSFIIPGINSLYTAGMLPFKIEDCTIAIFCALLLFLIPVSWKNHEFTLNWKWASRIPWGILLLFGSGMSLSAAFKASGLSAAIGETFTGITIPVILLVLLLAFAVMILTEFTSNTAVANIMIPIMTGVAAGLAVNPFILMITVAVASSLAFMLPVATPPNAVAYGTDYVNMRDMVTAGWSLNLIGIILFTILLFTLGFAVFGIDVGYPY